MALYSQVLDAASRNQRLAAACLKVGLGRFTIERVILRLQH